MIKFSKVSFLIIKVILVGDASVGKTNFAARIVKSNEFVGQKSIAPTIGV
jgi:GTPase SAR1 family protein